MIPELIYCASGNKRYAEIAIVSGYTYGSQMPGKVYFTPEFIDQDWKSPSFEKYINSAKIYKPRLATVLDLEYLSQLPRVMFWASCISRYVGESIIIIPKFNGAIKYIPDSINGVNIRLGYSVPTKYGKTDVPVEEFKSREVHLLGGSPKNQLKLANQMNVVSADGNYMGMKARKFLQYFDGERWIQSNHKYDPYECFAISCRNIKLYWENYYDI